MVLMTVEAFERIVLLTMADCASDNEIVPVKIVRTILMTMDTVRMKLHVLPSEQSSDSPISSLDESVTSKSNWAMVSLGSARVSHSRFFLETHNLLNPCWVPF